MKNLIFFTVIFSLSTSLAFADRYYYEIRDGQMYWDDFPVGYDDPFDQEEINKKGIVVDFDTFEVLSQRPAYAKDKNHVYALASIIKDADLESFEVLLPADKYGDQGLGLTDAGYTRDKNHVYRHGKIIEGADPESFRVMPYYSADKNNIYNNETKKIDLTQFDAATFDVDLNGGFGDKNGFYTYNEETGSYQKTKSIFLDLHPNHFLYEQVQKAVSLGFINGYPDDTIRLENEVNRAEFAKMLMLAFKEEEQSGVNLKGFPDVQMDQWYVPFLSKAVQLNMMKGYPDGTMKPGGTINKAEALKMVVQVLKSNNIPLQEQFDEVSEKLEADAEWYEKYRQFALFKNWDLDFLEVKDMPEFMTRGECIELILEALGSQGVG